MTIFNLHLAPHITSFIVEEVDNINKDIDNYKDPNKCKDDNNWALDNFIGTIILEFYHFYQIINFLLIIIIRIHSNLDY